MPGPLTLAVAEILSARFEDIELDQNEFAKLTEISQSQVSKYLRGVRSPNIDRLDAMCAALGLRISEVLQQADEMTPNRRSPGV